VSKLDDEQEKKIFHIETLNMMTKYQIVFLKLEASVYKIVATNKARKELSINDTYKKAFSKFRENAMIG
jgi:hypothetical protein